MDFMPSDAIWAERTYEWVPNEDLPRRLGDFTRYIMNAWETERRLYRRAYAMDGYPTADPYYHWSFDEARKVEQWEVMIVNNLVHPYCITPRNTLVVFVKYEHPDKRPGERYPPGTIPQPTPRPDTVAHQSCDGGDPCG